jgi:molybdopterin molybdotransferase
MMEKFITVNRARVLLEENISSIEPCYLPISAIGGLRLAEDILSPNDIPYFNQSSVDGYAFIFDSSDAQLKIVGQVQAGPNEKVNIQKGEAIRIFTGAPVPSGADTIVMQEKVSIEGDNLTILDKQLKKGDNLRKAGSEIPKNAIALKKGMVMNAAAIGVIASLGIENAKVIPPPMVTIIVTGNEIKRPGEELSFGEVYDSSSFAMKSILDKLGCKNIIVKYVKDELSEIVAQLKSAVDSSDLILLTGGVSVGDYDFTLQAFEACGINSVFHKIKQKPGKPLLFGKYNNKVVFGFPGNPASVLTCFYEYVYPSIGRMMELDLDLSKQYLKVTNDYSKPLGLTHFLKARVEANEVSILTGQESYKISSLAMANAFVVLGEEDGAVQKSDKVEVHLIPH